MWILILLFGEVVLRSEASGAVVIRRTASARWWLRWLARLLLRREAKALAALEGIDDRGHFADQNIGAIGRSNGDLRKIFF